MEVPIRAAEPGDAAALASLTAELGYDPGGVEDRVPGIISDPGSGLLVAEVGGEVAGWVHVSESVPVQVAPFAEVSGLVVAEEVRGTGVGAALMQAAIEWARERGLVRMRVRSNAVREGAHRFYERLGFAVEKTSLTFYKAI